jgi:hypothetical protein
MLLLSDWFTPDNLGLFNPESLLTFPVAPLYTCPRGPAQYFFFGLVQEGDRTSRQSIRDVAKGWEPLLLADVVLVLAWSPDVRDATQKVAKYNENKSRNVVSISK